MSMFSTLGGPCEWEVNFGYSSLDRERDRKKKLKENLRQWRWQWWERDGVSTCWQLCTCSRFALLKAYLEVGRASCGLSSYWYPLF
jgi:hypothetical protein